MPWFMYHRKGWQIAVDAVSKADADHHVNIHATGAEYDGNWEPSSGTHSGNYSPATAMVTTKRDEQIRERIRTDEK